MKSQITKDFDLKSKLRKLADGGQYAASLPPPPQVGTGMVANAQRVLGGRDAQLAAQEAAALGTPAPLAPAAPPAQPVGMPMTRTGGVRGFFGLADGGERPVPTLGQGMAANAQRALMGRDAQLAAQEAAALGAAPAPSLPPPPPPPSMPMTRTGEKRGFFGLRDGGKRPVGNHGGKVEGPGTPTSDEVGPVMLGDDEYVLPGDTADAVGRENLDALRLATHDFKDEGVERDLQKKTSGLRKFADGGGFTVGPDGIVRPRAPVGPAPQLPPPPVNGAVGPAIQPRTEKFMGMVDDVTPKAAVAEAPGMASRVGSALRRAAPGAAAVGGLVGAAESFNDQSTGYRDQFQRSMGVESPLGSVAADSARVLGNVGDAVTFGLAGRLGRGIASATGGGSFVDGFTGPSDRDVFEQNKMAQVMAKPGATPGAPAAPAAGVSDQPSAAAPVVPGSVQSRRLSEDGVPLATQNAAPLVTGPKAQGERVLATAGTDQYQNLGTYGGNANIYGRASDPSRPGRINDFTGTGPENGAIGSAGALGGTGAAVQSALRGLSGGTSAPGAATQPINQGAAVIGTGEDRFDKLSKELRGMYSAKGQGNLARRLADVEQLRTQDLNSRRVADTSRDNNAATVAQSGENARLQAQSSLLNTMSSIDNNAATNQRQLTESLLRAQQDAAKTAREGEEKGFERYNSAIDSMFQTPDGKGGFAPNKAQGEQFKAFIQASDPKAGQKFAAMTPQDQAVLLQRFKTQFDMQGSRNDAASRALFGGNVTNRIDMPAEVREATVNDVANNGLPVKDYLWSNLPFTNRNVVQGDSGQTTLLSDAATTGGNWDNDKLSIIESRAKNRTGSALRRKE
jgi:hypothetical protein